MPGSGPIKRLEGSISSSYVLTDIINRRMVEHCRELGISKSQFIREAIESALSRHKSKGYVYFAEMVVPGLREGGSRTIKIGRTTDLQRRLETDLGSKLPYPFKRIHYIDTMDMVLTEKLFLEHFFHCRLSNSEWFHLELDDIQWILNGDYTKEINASII